MCLLNTSTSTYVRTYVPSISPLYAISSTKVASEVCAYVPYVPTQFIFFKTFIKSVAVFFFFFLVMEMSRSIFLKPKQILKRDVHLYFRSIVFLGDFDCELCTWPSACKVCVLTASQRAAARVTTTRRR